MMRFITGACWVIAFLLTSAPCFGGPFLVSDPYLKTGDEPTGFSIDAGGMKFSVPPEKLPDGAIRLRFDLSQLPDGEQTIEIRALNELKRTESEPVQLRLLKNGEEVTIRAPQAKPEKQKIPPSRTIPGLLRP